MIVKRLNVNLWSNVIKLRISCKDFLNIVLAKTRSRKEIGSKLCVFASLREKIKLGLMTLLLAPVEVEILLCRCSAQKIATENGTMFPKRPNVSAPKE